jgi:hypothetical protein
VNGEHGLVETRSVTDAEPGMAMQGTVKLEFRSVGITGSLTCYVFNAYLFSTTAHYVELCCKNVKY